MNEKIDYPNKQVGEEIKVAMITWAIAMLALSILVFWG